MDKITYLMMNSSATSYVAATFHPTIGQRAPLISQQRCHPRAGHDSPRNKGTSKLTHSQGYVKHSQANTIGFIRPSRILGKAQC